VTLIRHQAQFWKWRMRGSFLTLAELLASDIDINGPPDVILMSSMTDVASFAGAIRHEAPGTPIATYFHESQFTYPVSPLDKPDATYPMKNWSSAAVSDLVIFNSEYHRSVFRSQAMRFLKSFPDHTHVHRLESVMEDAIVIPVGVDLAGLVGAKRVADGSPLVVWNHRWEHDKDPELLLEIARLLIERGAPFRFAMCGEVFVSVPESFAAVTSVLGDHLIHQGWAERDRYEALLLGASVVLSTSLQEFFGIGVVEGIAAGARPVLPNRLVYPERVSELGLGPGGVLYRSAGEAVDLIERAALRPVDASIREATMQYDWSTVAPRYDAALEHLAVTPTG
jgi:glycosyltransferase involved in cell wall biosynthesis